MKVSELRAILDNYPPDMEVITCLYEDYVAIEMHKIMVVAQQWDHYVVYKPTMLATTKVITALYIG